MKKVSLMIAALALVLGISQCKKQEKPVQAGEKQYIELTAGNGNDGSKVGGSFSAATMNLFWEEGDVITVSGGATGTLTLNDGAGTAQGHFSGEVTLDSRADLVFTWTKLEGEPDFNNQTGTEEWITDNLVLEAKAAYNESGKYNLKMEMPYAVLKLNLSAFGSADGNKVGIKVDGTVVATVAGIKNVAEAVFVAVPAAGIKKAYTISGNSKGNVKNWTLNPNTFYTADNGSGQGTGHAITIEHDPMVVDLNNLDLAEGSFGNLPLWVKYNLGVNPDDLDTPEKWYGDYYAWGETEPYYSSKSPLTWKDGKSGYSWQSYCGSSSFTEWDPLPYDENYVLKPDFDAARQHGSGDDWRLPTQEEWKALRKNTFCVKTTDYNNVTGLNGYIVYRVKDARDKNMLNTPASSETYTTADTHIFLPFTGYYSNKSRLNAAKKGYYWSSTRLTETISQAFETYIWGANINEPKGSDFYFGYPVHPVR